MSDEYQLRRDIDKLYRKTYDFEENVWNIYNKSEVNNIIESLWDDIYPIGTLYHCSNDNDPNIMFKNQVWSLRSNDEVKVWERIR